jgi:hypothetical protein
LQVLVAFLAEVLAKCTEEEVRGFLRLVWATTRAGGAEAKEREEVSKSDLEAALLDTLGSEEDKVRAVKSQLMALDAKTVEEALKVCKSTLLYVKSSL